jgi:hypothetical protein
LNGIEGKFKNRTLRKNREGMRHPNSTTSRPPA